MNSWYSSFFYGKFLCFYHLGKIEKELISHLVTGNDKKGLNITFCGARVSLSNLIVYQKLTDFREVVMIFV